MSCSVTISIYSSDIAGFINLLCWEQTRYYCLMGGVGPAVEGRIQFIRNGCCLGTKLNQHNLFTINTYYVSVNDQEEKEEEEL